MCKKKYPFLNNTLKRKKESDIKKTPLHNTLKRKKEFEIC